MISICIPSYNGNEYLSPCIESCLGQSYKDFEIVIVNDGSTDSTGEIIDYYEKESPRVRGITIQHSGISVARQTAVDNAKGQYIAVMDTDCQMDPNRLRDQLKAIKNVDIVYSAFYTTLQNKQIGLSKPEDITGKTYKDILDRKYPNSYQIVPNFTIMAKKECFKNVYRPEYKVNDDLIVILEWLKRGYKFKLIKNPLVMHFDTGYNVSTSRYDEVKKITDEIRKEYKI